MWRLLSNGAVIFAGIVSIPAIIAQIDAKLPTLAVLPAAQHKIDPRLQLLERFFDIADSPAKALAHIFLREADQFNLDWRLLPSISFVETSAGKAARNNNMFGWDCGRARFSSLAEGIHAVAYHLATAKAYKNKGLDELLWAYNPNPEYSRIVKSVMYRIAPPAIPE